MKPLIDAYFKCFAAMKIKTEFKICFCLSLKDEAYSNSVRTGHKRFAPHSHQIKLIKSYYFCFSVRILKNISLKLSFNWLLRTYFWNAGIRIRIRTFRELFMTKLMLLDVSLIWLKYMYYDFLKASQQSTVECYFYILFFLDAEEMCIKNKFRFKIINLNVLLMIW